MKRNYGIDLLRMVAMLFVAGLHILGIGGVLAGSALLSGQFLTAQLLRMAMLCAVNCYALISGYVGWSRSPKLSALAMLWLKALCFCILFTVIFHPADWRAVVCALFPVSTGQYWYLTAYAGLFVLMPLLNAAVRHMPKRELAMTLGGIFLLFSLLPISPLTDAFYLHDGYSVLWLAVVYLLGGFLGKYDLLSRPSGRTWFLVYCGAVLFAWAPRMLALGLLPSLWDMAKGNIVIEYTSPTILLAAVSALALFSRLGLSGGLQKAVSLLSPHAFGVYLFHSHPLMFRLLDHRFAALGTAPVPVLIAAVALIALLLYAAGTAADWLLCRLIRLTRLDRLLKKLDRLP